MRQDSRTRSELSFSLRYTLGAIGCLIGLSVWTLPPLLEGAEVRQESRSLGADVGETVRASVEADWIEQDQKFSKVSPAHLALQVAESPTVTTRQDAAGAVDGIKDGRFGFHVAVNETDPWWQVDLGRDYSIDRIVVFNRTDNGLAPRTRNIGIQVASETRPGQFVPVYQHDGTVFHGIRENAPLVVRFEGKGIQARIVRLHMSGPCALALDEVEVYAVDNPNMNIALKRPADQKSVSTHSRDKSTNHIMSDTPGQDDRFTLRHSREISRRARELASRLRPRADARRLEPLVDQLEQLDLRLDDVESGSSHSEPIRRETYFAARHLLRAIAFTNPLLDIDRLLFVKRHRGSLPHICDQYYGFTAVPGGGLFVLTDPFSEHPRLANLLENAVVGEGRLAGRSLDLGAFLSPEVSYDGSSVFFAYTENREPMRSWDEVWPPSEGKRKWTPTNCYHLFRVGSDGNGLVQLTDGPWNDFDPCMLPNGRIAFISERRGGYVRCGIRACRSFNLCSMDENGDDMIPLSHHETNEWHPSVSNDGMLLFTRWDYVDRNTQIAHHLWTCYPDGRDPRAPHGNYPVDRRDRPWAELSIRAIPDSDRLVATAAPHHGYAFGSLVLIDRSIVDDGGNSQITRLTPEVPFPEGEGPIRENEVYGTAWPLSEDDFLCAYDPQAAHHAIYWIDRAGNRELIYGDPHIACISPMPLRARAVPPVIPDQTRRARIATSSTENRESPFKTSPDEYKQSAETKRPSSSDAATIALLNVYDSRFEWPDATQITHLRVIQILPKSTPSRNTPRVGIAEQTNARAVLGTVPVETDGSAYFEAPPGKSIYFQALDARGMAVQSMRSGTYVHPGERLTCQGCHEPKQLAPAPRDGPPLALLRPPSKLMPEPEGSNPFSYVRLVQPVLDRHCVDCHREKGAIDLSGPIEVRRCPRDSHKPVSFTKSYDNLAEKFGFFFHAHSTTSIANIPMDAIAGGRTTAGQFGARASRLVHYLDDRHYGVRLPPDDFRRIVLWLDCNSEFLGAYEDAEAQARGEKITPSLE
ncbi:MAG: hypothetical protein FJ297_03215 [Planctomycetes bacterium]|nr:hypothetical protein [Planctomycetota bacterium]